MPGSNGPEQNHLLAALPPAERERVYPHLQLAPMPLGKVVYEPGVVLRHVYFPTDCIVSLLYVMKDGASAEIALVGNEGIIGVALFMGGETMSNRAIVQSAGSAYRLTGMLGVRREGVTSAAARLQKLGAIRYTRGRITVVDRPKLEKLCCECYAVVKKETDRLAL
jgi:hypothetical protein